MFFVLVSVSLAATKDYDPLTLPNLRVLGRTGKDVINFYWTGSGIELDLYGSELWIQVDVDWSWAEIWISALEKNRTLLRRPLVQGKQWIQLFRGFDASKSHHIKVLRESQGTVDAVASIKLTGIRFDGELHQLPAPKLRIEFIGDSYVSGECALGQPADTEWIPLWFSAAINWPRLCAQTLSADYRIVSVSGWGCVSSHDNNPNSALPKIYEYIAGQVSSGKGSNLQKYDFKSWLADIIVVALGTNDKSAWSKAAYNFGGQEYKNTPALFEDAAYKFLVRIRELNPKSYIAWQFFEGDNQVNPILERVIAKFQKEHDQKCSLILIPPWKMTGCNQHPGIEDHQTAGKLVAQKIAQILGIPYTG